MKASVSDLIPQSLLRKLNHIRMLPDFIIIGAQKCGTTSLYNYLVQHPNVMPARKKEVHFFDINYHKGSTWYRSHFPLVAYKYYVKHAHGIDLVTGEASPYYIFHPLAATRVHRLVPDAKLVALLRNPVDRAYSHYHHAVRVGGERLSLREGIECEAGRLDGERERILSNASYFSHSHQHYSYLCRGIYVDQLAVWLNLFSRERVLILKSEDFFARPRAILNQVLGFLNLPDWGPTEYRNYGRASYPEMDADVRERLREYYRPHNERLYELLGIDFGWDA